MSSLFLGSRHYPLGIRMQALLDPAILFFLLGALAGFLKSNLEIPPQISRFLALYLLMALGLKGGFALAKSGFTSDVAMALALALLLAVLIPGIGYLLMRKLLAPFDAAAVAATYGSVSAVTFITAVQFMESHGYAFGGHMAAAMALMESPAIIIAIAVASKLRKTQPLHGTPSPPLVTQSSLKGVLHESLTDGAQFLLLGSMVVGFMTGQDGKLAMEPFTGDLFKGMLAFFLLDMGLSAARNLPKTKGSDPLDLCLRRVCSSTSRRSGIGSRVLLRFGGWRRCALDGLGGECVLHCCTRSSEAFDA